MIKKLNYFFQAFIIYLIFFVGRILGIKISRKLFSHIFCLVGPIFKSKKIITSNIKIFSKNISDTESKGIIDNMWRNYGKTFIEYIFLDYFRKNNNHMEIVGLNNISEQIEVVNQSYSYLVILLILNLCQWKLQKRILI